MLGRGMGSVSCEPLYRIIHIMAAGFLNMSVEERERTLRTEATFSWSLNLKSRLPEEISTTSDMQMIPDADDCGARE